MDMLDIEYNITDSNVLFSQDRTTHFGFQFLFMFIQLYMITVSTLFSMCIICAVQTVGGENSVNASEIKIQVVNL